MNILEISPKDRLSFTGPFTREVSSTLTLRNLSNKSVYFKLKCNSSSGNHVTPNKGIIMQSESIDVNIFIEPFKEDPKSKILKFLVQYLQKDDDTVLDSVDNAFANYKNKIPHFLLECEFLINPFDDGTPSKTASHSEDLYREVLQLRKENKNLKEEIESLNETMSPSSDYNFFKSNLKAENEKLVSFNKSIEEFEEIKKEINSSFDQLIREFNLRREAILKKLIQTKDKFTAEKEIQEKKISHYQERLTRDTRALTDVTDNFELDVQQTVNEFLLSKVGELSHRFSTEPMVYFEFDLGSFESALDSYIVFKIGN